jgi:hypothetical protein
MGSMKVLPGLGKAAHSDGEKLDNSRMTWCMALEAKWWGEFN